MAWAGVERLLDELIAFHQQQFTDLSQEHPRSLSKKLEYLKRTMQRDRRLPWGTREFFRQTRITAKRLGDERHEITHGVIRRQGTSLIWRSQRVLYDGPNARVKIRDFHNNELCDILKEIGEFGRFLGPRVWILIGNNHRDAPSGEIEEVLRELLRTHPPVTIP